MRTKMLGVGLVLVVALFFAPSKASACRTCDNPAFWSPNCALSCSYCAACTICCGGDPGAGGHCAEYCGGPDFASTGTALNFSPSSLTPVQSPNETPEFLATTPGGECSAAGR